MNPAIELSPMPTNKIAYTVAPVFTPNTFALTVAKMVKCPPSHAIERATYIKNRGFESTTSYMVEHRTI